MKALSIKQPWAWLICAGYKDIENRNRPTSFTGRIYVHAGKRFQGASLDEAEQCFLGGNVPPDIVVMNGKLFCPMNDWLEKVIGPMARRETNTIYTLGALIGEVDIIDCISESKSRWFTGPYGFVLANPVLYHKPIPCKGKLGFFEPEFELIK